MERIISDAEGNLEKLIQSLQKKHVGILNTGLGTLNAYDLLLKYGIDICCFISGTIDCDDRKIFGKPLTGRMQAEVEWADLVLIDPDAKYSAWGFGQTDMCSYLGFRRNRQFFALRDYIAIPNLGFQNILKYGVENLMGRIVLAGDLWLCLKLEQILGESAEFCGKIVYCNVLEKNMNASRMNEICVNELKSEDICLLVLPEYYGCVSTDENGIFYKKTVLNRYKKILTCKTENIIEYPFEDIKCFKRFSDKTVLINSRKTDIVPAPAKIILGAINSFSGNIFFRQVLTRHPDIIMIPYSYLSFNLYSICERLSMECSSNILTLFWKINEEESRYLKRIFEKDIFFNKCVFDQSMLEFLDKKSYFTSWELFVMIHISFAKMLGKEIDDISKMTIYWEPHYVDVNRKEAYTEWLDKIGSKGYIVNIVRDAFTRAGSSLSRWNGRKDVQMAIINKFPNEEKRKDYKWKRIVLKFENLKKNAKEEFQEFCKKMGIRWSDQLLDDELSFENTSIFNLTPVYRTWEKYFSSFDRFRLCLIMEPWQKEYGYSYVSSLDFSRSELQKMFLKKFRFEDEIKFENDEVRVMQRERSISQNLWKIRKKEVMRECWDGVEQDEIQDCSKNVLEI